MSIIIDELDLSPDNHSQNQRRMAIASPFLHKMQRRHFVLFNVLPLVGSVAAIVLAAYQPIGWSELTLFLGMWLLTGLGISAGYHRLFCHRSFKTTAPVRVVLAVLGSMAALGGVISWVAMHRRHHQCADRDGDMHSPNLHGSRTYGCILGFIHAHLTWMIKHDYPNVSHYAPDLLRDKAVVSTARHYRWWVLLGLVLPAAIDGCARGTWNAALDGFLWGGVVRMFVVAQAISALNSVLHTMGSKPFHLRENPSDNSRNSWLLGVLIWGEGWHNNHHAFPDSASFGLKWYRVDLSYWLILLLQALGLAWDVRVPAETRIAARAAGGDVVGAPRAPTT